MPNKDLELRIIATNLASRVFDKIEADLKKLANTSNSSISGLNPVFSGLATTAGGISDALVVMGNVSKTVFSAFGSVIGDTLGSLFSMQTVLIALFTGYGIMEYIKNFINLNAEFEKMKVSMNVLTQGRGEEYFNRLNQWALNMPVSMAEVSKAFITMKAYGLEPTVKMMENLVNVASVLPESGRAIVGIARALGQIQAKSRLEGQELRQLAEWAVPGYETVYTKLFTKLSQVTGIAVSKLKFTMIDSQTALKALEETIVEHFGGAAKAISGTWSGLMIRMQNHVKEFFREIGEGGAMDPLKKQLEKIVDWLSDEFKSGKMQKNAKLVGETLSIAFNAAFDIIKSLFETKGVIDWGNIFITVLNKLISGFTIFVNTISGIEIVLSIVKLAWLYFAEALNNVIYGLIWGISKFIDGFKYLVDLLPTAIPGVKSLQNAFKTTSDFMKGMSEEQGANIVMLDNMVTDTNNNIVSTANAITKRSDIAEKAIEKITVAYEKYQKTVAVPPPGEKINKYPGIDKVDVMDYSELNNAKIKEHEKYWKMINKIDEEEIRKENKGSLTKKQLDDWYKRDIAAHGTFTQKLSLGWEEYMKKVHKTVIKPLQAYFEDFFNSLESGFSNAFMGILNGTMNFTKGFHAILKTIEQAFFQMIANMAATWLMNQTRMLIATLFTQKAITTATAEGEAERTAIEETSALTSIAIAIGSAIKKIAIYAYEAAAAAFTALAGIPIIGPFLAIGAAAAALGTVLGFAAKVASFEKGTGLMGVRENGPAMLHKGEIVLNKKESDAYRQGVSSGGGSASSNNITMSFHINAMDGASVEKVVRKQIIPMLRDNVRDFGKMRTLIGEAK